VASRGGGLRASQDESQEEKEFPFLLFKYFKAFSNDFESYFEFESNHSIPKIQMQQHECTNM
jgi:hypothetical protein